jgi:biopolymer transport protein ExbD
MGKKAKRRIGVGIDMTPMVDIAFLLLIFYMTTTQFKPPEKQQVTLPMSESQYKLPMSDIINITVNKEDSIFIEFITNFAAKRDTLIDGVLHHAGDTTTIRQYIDVEPKTLNREFLKVQSVFLGKGVNPMVIVKADRDSRYGTIKKIMDTLQDVNINRFSLMTEVKRGQFAPVPGSEG